MTEPFGRRYVKRETAQARAYSQAVVTLGGTIVWLAGQVGASDMSGRSLAGDFDGQVREIFSRLGHTLEEAGGKLADMVTMTVFITDARHGDRFTQLRKEIFGRQFSRERTNHRSWPRPPGDARRSSGNCGDRVSPSPGAANRVKAGQAC